jgi:hypothetical protein
MLLLKQIHKVLEVLARHYLYISIYLTSTTTKKVKNLPPMYIWYLGADTCNTSEQVPVWAEAAAGLARGPCWRPVGGPRTGPESPRSPYHS